MRHIPEEEIHAYLDQALSRSQCVEIESHLASCSACCELRNEIAALRDRTTALLAHLAPATTLPPPFDLIRARYQQTLNRRRRWTERGAWAASVLVALGAGWSANQFRYDRHVQPGESTQPHLMQAAAESGPLEPGNPAGADRPLSLTPSSLTAREGLASGPGGPKQRVRPTETRPATDSSAVPGLIAAFHGVEPERLFLEISALDSRAGASRADLEGVWRTVPLDDTLEGLGSRVPLVTGLPVVQVQVQRGKSDEEITAVDQQLASGETIRTIEGPAAQVSDILAKQSPVSPAQAPESEDSSGRPAPDATLTLRQGNRMLAVTGPSDLLHSLMTRVRIRRWR